MGCGFYVEAESGTRGGVSATIYLARHGSHAEVGTVLSGRSAIPLSDAGRAEARRLAGRLDGMGIARIHSSPTARARETAAIVAERLGLPVEIADALDEIDFGAWAGRSFAALADDPSWQAWNSRRGEAMPPGGESMAAATARARRHIEAQSAGTILCVTHCDIIRGLAAHYLGLGLDRLLAFDCDPASLTILALFPGGGRVVTLNERMQ